MIPPLMLKIALVVKNKSYLLNNIRTDKGNNGVQKHLLERTRICC